MAASLGRRGGALLGQLARLASTAAAPPQAQGGQMVIAAEVAQLVSVRGGMTTLPPDIAAAIDKAAKGSLTQL